MRLKLLFLYLLMVSFACNNSAHVKEKEKPIVNIIPLIASGKNEYKQIKNIPLPDGFERILNDENSFAAWLENIYLKEDKTVYKFDGSPKYNQAAQFAVLDISVGKKDLQQCADAVMRLRAEYLFSQKRFEEIIFIDNANTQYKFHPPYNRENFAKYLERVFGMCGSASLANQLRTVNEFNDIEAGNVIIRGGFPGHAVMVMDVAVNAQGEKIYLLAQSYMPAQDIHVLLNPTNGDISPWYKVTGEKSISTPEYLFYKNELRKW